LDQANHHFLVYGFSVKSEKHALSEIER
jgi:hypothetical protein